MPIFRPRRRKGDRTGSGSLAKVPLNSVRRSLLRSALACGASALPNEFGGMLRSEEPGVITDLVLLPGTTAGHRHANLQLWMLPADFSIVGTVHSHPSGALHPSEADLQLFHHWGLRHMILGRPFTQGCWRAYDGRGQEVRLQVIEDTSSHDPEAEEARPARTLHRGLSPRVPDEPPPDWNGDEP